MFNDLKKQFAQLKEGRPGCRFVAHYERRHVENRKKSPWKRVAYLTLGIGLLIAGVILSIAPVVPGFILLLPAAGLLVSEIRTLAVGLDRAELFVRHIAARFSK